MKNKYKPEGYVSSHEKYRSKNTSQSLINCDCILEGTAIKCDSSLNLWVDYTGIKCKMPKEEVTYLFPGEKEKDIAVISRVGKCVAFKVIGVCKNEKGEDEVIISRRLAQLECLREYIDKLSIGDVIDARITHMEQFGAFCDIGCGIVALLSVDCISISRISHPKDRFEIGDNIRAIVKSRNEQGRIYLTHRELLGTWEENAALFSQGQTVAGIIRSVESYGVFIELTPNLAGLAETREDVYPSQSTAVYIKSIIPERMKIKLVLISGKGSDLPKAPIEYIGDLYKQNHIDHWVYSPTVCNKIIESDFR